MEWSGDHDTTFLSSLLGLCWMRRNLTVLNDSTRSNSATVRRRMGGAPFPAHMPSGGTMRVIEDHNCLCGVETACRAYNLPTSDSPVLERKPWGLRD